MSKTLLIMAGGTGGHVFPGLAVADFLRDKGWTIVWMGNPSGIEARLVPARGYEMASVRFGGLRGKGWKAKLKLPFTLLSALYEAAREISRIKPNVVLGMGGYISFPGGLMARLLGYPLVIHEQNSIAGLANRALSFLANKTLCAFPDALPRSEWVGNPVRQEIAEINEPEVRFKDRLNDAPLHLLVLGGSLGAVAINKAVPQGIALIAPEKRPLVIHQSGEKHLATLTENYAAAGVEAKCVAFIDDMREVYEWADIVLCRAGALTISELAACGVASILVPYPWAVDDHQTSNARFLVSAGAAFLLPEKDLSPEAIALISNYSKSQLYQMAAIARRFAKPQATADLANALAKICEEVAKP